MKGEGACTQTGRGGALTCTQREMRMHVSRRGDASPPPSLFTCMPPLLFACTPPLLFACAPPLPFMCVPPLPFTCAPPSHSCVRPPSHSHVCPPSRSCACAPSPFACACSPLLLVCAPSSHSHAGRVPPPPSLAIARGGGQKGGVHILPSDRVPPPLPPPVHVHPLASPQGKAGGARG
jgi:hypothetical protein